MQVNIECIHFSLLQKVKSKVNNVVFAFCLGLLGKGGDPCTELRMGTAPAGGKARSELLLHVRPHRVILCRLCFSFFMSGY